MCRYRNMKRWRRSLLEKGNKFIEKWMAFVTPLCMLAGISFPDVAAHGLPYVTMVFAFITFTGALKSEFKDVLRVFHDPKPLLCMLGDDPCGDSGSSMWCRTSVLRL